MDLPNLDVCFNCDGWGPVIGERIAGFENVPYAQFDKKEKCWKPADFSQAPSYAKQYPRHRRGEEAAVNIEFSYKHDSAEDSTFRLVDTSKTQSRSKSSGVKRTWTQNTRGGRGGAANRPGQRAGPQRPEPVMGGPRSKSLPRGGKGASKYRNNQNKRNDRKVDRVPSLNVRGEWVVIEEIDLPQLLKLQANQPKATDLLWCGHLDQYDEAFDKLTSKISRPLRRVENKVFYSVNTTDDPILERFAIDRVGNVFATDSIIAQLMAAPRSVYSWDIVIEKIDGLIYLDKRENSPFDFLTVSETAQDPPTAAEDVEEINRPDKLSVEATMINQNFSQQILKDDNECRRYYEPNPFHDETARGEAAGVAYRYRKFALGDINLVVRCELHGWTQKRNEDLYITSHSLNEWDSKYSGGVEWRQKIDQQRSAIFATEVKNNSCKLARWTAESILANADLIKLGYVSRVNKSSSFDHAILATQFFKPKELATTIAMTLNNMWGIVKMICDLISNQEDGKYVLLKDPNRPVVRLYSVPVTAFESDEDGDENEGLENEDAEEDADNGI